jgi:putative endopeptidase
MKKSCACLCLAIAAALGGCAYTHPPAIAARPPARIGAWGLDLTTRDATVRPGDDFFRYADGHWLDTTQIPADRSRWGAFDALAEDAQNKVHELIETLPVTQPRKKGARFLSRLHGHRGHQPRGPCACGTGVDRDRHGALA